MKKQPERRSAPSVIVKNYAHVSNQLPRVDPKNPYWHKFTKQGKPVCENKRDVQQLSAITGGKFKWD